MPGVTRHALALRSYTNDEANGQTECAGSAETRSTLEVRMCRGFGQAMNAILRYLAE
jgi:hypothetical protein